MELRMNSVNLLMFAAVCGCQNFTFFNLRAAGNLFYYASYFQNMLQNQCMGII